jgi:hypothetical protein
MVQTSLIGTVAILAGVVFVVRGMDIGLGPAAGEAAVRSVLSRQLLESPWIQRQRHCPIPH